jgi:hypothetical protein
MAWSNELQISFVFVAQNSSNDIISGNFDNRKGDQVEDFTVQVYLIFSQNHSSMTDTKHLFGVK